MRSLRSAARCLSLAAFLCMHWHGGSALANAPTLPEERIELTGRLTASQRAFVLRLPELERDRRDMVRSLLRQRIYWGEFDLDGDGVAERFVILEFSGMCGWIGCSTTIFKFGPKGWELAGGIGADRDSLWILPETDNGWRRINTGTVFYRFPCGYLDDELIDDYRERGREPCDDD